MSNRSQVDNAVYEVLPRGATNPPAGSDKIFSAEADERLEIISASCVIDTDGNAANRLLVLKCMNSGAALWIPDTTIITANQVVTLYWGIGVQEIDHFATNSIRLMPLPESLILVGADEIIFALENVEAGDQISDIQFMCKVWRNV